VVLLRRHAHSSHNFSAHALSVLSLSLYKPRIVDMDRQQTRNALGKGEQLYVCIPPADKLNAESAPVRQ